MAMKGNAPPVRIPLNGESMFPLIRWGKDFVTIIPPDRELVPGDIVLVSEPDTGRYIMHRVWTVQDGQVLTWGDNCDEPDRWVFLDAVWGRAVLIERGRRRIQPDPERGMRWMKFWRKAGIGYRIVVRFRNRIVEKIRKLIK